MWIAWFVQSWRIDGALILYPTILPGMDKCDTCSLTRCTQLQSGTRVTKPCTTALVVLASNKEEPQNIRGIDGSCWADAFYQNEIAWDNDCSQLWAKLVGHGQRKVHQNRHRLPAWDWKVFKHILQVPWRRHRSMCHTFYGHSVPSITRNISWAVRSTQLPRQDMLWRAEKWNSCISFCSLLPWTGGR